MTVRHWRQTPAGHHHWKEKDLPCRSGSLPSQTSSWGCWGEHWASPSPVLQLLLPLNLCWASPPCRSDPQVELAAAGCSWSHWSLSESASPAPDLVGAWWWFSRCLTGSWSVMWEWVWGPLIDWCGSDGRQGCRAWLEVAAAAVVPSVSLKHSDSRCAGWRAEVLQPKERNKHSAVIYTKRSSSVWDPKDILNPSPRLG